MPSQEFGMAYKSGSSPGANSFWNNFNNSTFGNWWNNTAVPWLGDSIDSFTGKAQVELGREQLDWEKTMTETMMDREDNAVQRRANDLEQAGLSKTLAAGSAASAQQASRLGGFDTMAKGLETRGKMLGTIADISRSAAETRLMNTEATKKDSERKLIEGTTPQKIELNRLEIEKRLHQNDILKDTKEWQKIAIRAKSATARSEQWTAAEQATIKNIDRIFYQDLQSYIQAEGAENGVFMNPAILKWITEKTILDIKKYDFNWYKEHEQPYSGNTNMWTSLIGAGDAINKVIGGKLNLKNIREKMNLDKVLEFFFGKAASKEFWQRRNK